MRQSTQKLTRGQMVYAPISSSQNRSKSPFSSNKKIITGTKSQQNLNQQQPKSVHKNTPYTNQQSYNIISRQNMQSPITNNNLSMTNPYTYHQYQQVLNNLQKQNEVLKSRQEIFISKLMKLQQGLQKQHQQFMNLQQLYEQLFNRYKQRQQEISQLQARYRQTQRSRNQMNIIIPKIQQPLPQMQKFNSIKHSIYEQNLKNQIALLIFQNKRLNQINQKLLSQLNYIKSKQKLNDSRKNLQQKVFDQLQDYQKIVDSQKQDKIKLQYQNKFFKLRIQDLQKTILQLQKVISLKQNQIIKMRQQKMHIRRQSSQKVLNRSPPKSNTIDSSRSKNNPQQNKKIAQLIQNLQKQNQRLRQQNISLKQKCRGMASTQKQHSRVASQDRSNAFIQNRQHHHTRIPLLHRKLQFQGTQNHHKYQNEQHQNSLRSYQNQNFNSQNTNEQYFSFSRERDQKLSSQSDLPTFPMDLEIQGIIRKHTDHVTQKQQNQQALTN